MTPEENALEKIAEMPTASGRGIRDGEAEGIAGRKPAEEALHESEERFRAIFELAAVGVAQVAKDGAWLDVNQRFCDIVGYTREELLGRTFQDITHPDDLDADLGHVRQMLAGEISTYAMEKRYIRKDGGIVWINLTVSLVRETSGAPKYFISVVENITERKQAEEAVRDSETRLRMAVEAGNVGLWDWDLHTNAVFFSPEWKMQIGYRDEELSDNFEEWRSRVHPEDLDPALSKVAAYLENPQTPHEVEFRLRHKDGSYRWIYAQGELVRDSTAKPVRMLGCQIDITDRKRAEDAVRESEVRYRQLFDANPHPMWVYDIGSLRFLAVNAAAIAHYGYSREEFLAMTIKDIRPPEDIPALLAEVAAVTEGLSKTRTWHHRKRDGTLINVETSSHVLEFGGHRAEIVLAHDITERLRSEARLLQAEDSERRRIAKELHDSTAQDLVAVIMNLGALHESLSPGNPKAARILADSIALVENSVNDIRTLSYVLHPPRLDETGLAGALAEYAAGFTTRTDTRIRVEIAPDFGRLPEDMEIVLFRVVQEGIANVLRHAGSDTATIRLARDEENVVLEIEDYGRGMADAGARGVGISGMRERLQHLGGRLEMESDGGGTIVRAVLPLRENRK